MKTSLVFKYFAFVGFAISESTILTTPPDASSCSGKNVTIAWTYNPANLVSAVWTFTNDTLPEQDILRKIGTDPPTPPASPPLTVEFVENGTIQLINTSPSYTGTYIFKTADNTGNQDSDSVNITINDVPQSLVFLGNVTSHTFTCSGSSSIPTVIRVSTSDGNFRYEASPYISSDTTEGIECCYNGSAASCSTETFTANYDGTIYCQQVRDAPTTVPPTLSTTTQIIQNTTDPAPCSPWCPCNLPVCILVIVISLLGGIGGCIAVAIYYSWSKRKCCFKKKVIVIPANENGGKPPDEERIASASHVEMGDISSETNIFVQKGLSGDMR